MGCEDVDSRQEGERDVGRDAMQAQMTIALFGHYVSFSFFTAHHCTTTTINTTSLYFPPSPPPPLPSPLLPPTNELIGPIVGLNDILIIWALGMFSVVQFLFYTS
jgi:hypothetical protein